jgi:hypothetical protein
MYHLIIDTCVWIDLCKNFPEVRRKISDLIEQEKVRLLLPQIIIDEWNRHKHKIVDSKQASIHSMIKNARSLSQYLEHNKADKLRTILDELHEEDVAEESALKEIEAVENLFAHPSTIRPPLTEKIKARAADLALANKAPFQDKNSMADALIVLSSAEYILQKDLNNPIFVSINTKDFSSSAHKTEIHEDLKEIFDECKMRYFANIGQTINEIETDLISVESVNEIEEAIQFQTIQSVLEDYQQTLKSINVMGGLAAIQAVFRTGQQFIDAMGGAAASQKIFKHYPQMQEVLKTIDAMGGAAASQKIFKHYPQMQEALKAIDAMGGAAAIREALKAIDAMGGGAAASQKTLQESSKRNLKHSNQTRSKEVKDEEEQE